jgi:hypothetical protein
LLTDAAIAQRVVNKHRFLRRPTYTSEYGRGDGLRILVRLARRGLIPGGLSTVYHFARSLPWRAPRNIPLAIADWIQGLSMRDYVDRNFGAVERDLPPLWTTRVARLTDALSHYQGEGKVMLSHQIATTGIPLLTLSLSAWRNSRLFMRVTRQLCALLRDTPSRLTLRFDEIGLVDLPHVRRLLRKLARFGDRVSIEMGEILHSSIAQPR